MIRLLFGCVVTVIAARWLYSEVQLSFPQVVPFIDYALENVQIPTHDKWDMQTWIDSLDSKHKGEKRVAARRVSASRTLDSNLRESPGERQTFARF